MIQKVQFSKYSINILRDVEFILKNVTYGKIKHCEMHDDTARASKRGQVTGSVWADKLSSKRR